MMKPITDSMLRGACRDQRKLFRKTFPDGAPITMVAVRKAQRAGLDVLWLVNILPPPLYDAYEASVKPLYDAYEASVKPDACWASVKPLYDAYWASRIKVLLALLRRA